MKKANIRKIIMSFFFIPTSTILIYQ